MWELKYLNDRDDWNMHDVEPVIHYDWPDGWGGRTVPKKEPSGIFHCKNCKLQGSPNTFQRYSCLPSPEFNWMKECGCPQCKRRDPCAWAKVSMMCHRD